MFRTFLVFFGLGLLFFCPAFSRADDPAINTLVIADSYARFVSGWRECRYSEEAVVYLIVDGKEVPIFSEITRVVFVGERSMRYSKSINDPKNLEDNDIGISEQVLIINDNKPETLLNFSRSEDLEGLKSLPADFTNIIRDQEPKGLWEISLSDTISVYSRPNPPALIGFADDDWLNIPKILAGPLEDSLPRRIETIEGKNYNVVAVQLRNDDRGTAELLFDVDNELQPIGLISAIKRVHTTYEPFGYRSVAEMPPYLKKQLPKTINMREYFIGNGRSKRELIRYRDNVYLDGHEDHEVTRSSFRNLKFSADATDLVIPVSIPNGTEVYLASSPQIKAEWRDGNVVEVYRGEVIAKLATATMAGSNRFGLYLGLFGGVVLLMGVFYWKWLHRSTEGVV